MTNQKVKQLNLEDIIKQKQAFSNDNPFYFGEEFESTIRGENKAYSEMLSDIDLSISDFYYKYIHKLARSQGYSDDIYETIAYTGTLEEILEIINPFYRYVEKKEDLEFYLCDVKVRDFSVVNIIENWILLKTKMFLMNRNSNITIRGKKKPIMR